MHYTTRTTTWVVYHAAVPANQTPTMAMCEQHQWEALQRTQPDRFVLVQAGIPNNKMNQNAMSLAALATDLKVLTCPSDSSPRFRTNAAELEGTLVAVTN